MASQHGVRARCLAEAQIGRLIEASEGEMDAYQSPRLTLQPAPRKSQPRIMQHERGMGICGDSASRGAGSFASLRGERRAGAWEMGG